MRATAFYILAYIGLTFYGGQVCPFLESISIQQVAINLAVFFVPCYLLRVPAKKALAQYAPKITRRTSWGFMFEFSLFFLIGVSISVYDMFVYNFPIESGLKVLLGCATFGFFASLDLSLEKERQLITKLNTQKQNIQTGKVFLSVPRKFGMVTTLTFAFSTSILLLLVFKDLTWLTHNITSSNVVSAKSSVVKEISLVSLILFLLTLNLIFSYSKNLTLCFKNQTEALEQVSSGNFEAHVSVVSNDEFGLIAGHTNSMIAELKEKQKFKNILGKVVSPQIAKKLSEQTQLTLGGQLQNLVILFSDIRGFTSLSEKQAPEKVVKNLNLYLSKMVGIINHHEGLVDKFIGDGMLAVFGLEHSTHAAEQAVAAALQMQQQARQLSEESTLESTLNGFSIGIGIHQGHVIAGLIGSPERLEFTFIGDVVNTASRLESLTKKLNTDILISSQVHQSMGGKLAKMAWKNFDNLLLKGKQKKISAFGLDHQAFLV